MINGTIVGRVGNEPGLQYSESKGTPVLELSVAFDNGFDKGEKQTSWARVTLFGRTAESLAQHISKGLRIAASGQITLSQWTSRDGKPGAQIRMNASSIQLLDRPAQQVQQGQWTD